MATVVIQQACKSRGREPGADRLPDSAGQHSLHTPDYYPPQM